MTSLIQLEGLSVQLGDRMILKSLNGALQGRVVGLLGPNGSGKSTLINTLLGFYTPVQGRASVLGHDIAKDRRTLQQIIGYMPESDSFIAGMSGIRFVCYMAELSGLPKDEALERAHEAFYYVGLGEVRYRKVGTYSLGMKQLTKLAQAIVHGPKVLFLDEPTNGLDPPARLRMLQLIREIRDTGQIRIIITSHLLRDIEECCDEVMILRDGQIAASCNLEAERRANKRYIEMETLHADQAFAEAIQRLGCETAWFNNGRIKVLMPEHVEMKQLYALAEERNIQIRKMNYRRDSLEDIFLKAMEQTGAAANGSL